MANIVLNTKAPDFHGKDFTGKEIKLSDFKGQSNVLIVLNRGFV